MILLDRLIQISDHILNKEIVYILEAPPMALVADEIIAKYTEYDYFELSTWTFEIRIFIEEKIIEVYDRSNIDNIISKFDMNELMELKDEDRSYLVLKYGKVLLEEFEE